jgi:hypothetical protein
LISQFDCCKRSTMARATSNLLISRDWRDISRGEADES